MGGHKKATRKGASATVTPPSGGRDSGEDAVGGNKKVSRKVASATVTPPSGGKTKSKLKFRRMTHSAPSYGTEQTLSYDNVGASTKKGGSAQKGGSMFK
jgi:hypothetical protein